MDCILEVWCIIDDRFVLFRWLVVEFFWEGIFFDGYGVNGGGRVFSLIFCFGESGGVVFCFFGIYIKDVFLLFFCWIVLGVEEIFEIFNLKKV